MPLSVSIFLIVNDLSGFSTLIPIKYINVYCY